jgi:DNA helicase II / ATP-dependent DNA helicase PcrA
MDRENDLNKSFENGIENEIAKELEKESEKEKLQETIKTVNREIINYINKRKNISNYILDYRKEVIDEYRDDEDKIMEYFDHERFVKEEAFKTIDRRLKELIILAQSPYFGKVNFIEEDSDFEENIYVGRFGMTPEGSYEPVVVDWRAPISALFYSGKLGEVKYKAPMGEIGANILAKKQFIIKKAKLLGMFDSSVEVKDDILQMVLSANSSEKLKDIIMTIQEEQDNLIRQPRNKSIVVNGVAGSGKTTIALHRVAFLLYNYRESLQDKVLILGPNSIFMEYISTVLPSLGEVGVKQKTFRDFALEILNLDEVMSFKEYIERVLSKDEEFIKEILYKQSEEFTAFLDNEINKIDNSYFEIKDVIFRRETIVTRKEIEDMFQVHYKHMPLFRRTKRIKRVIFSKLRDARDEAFRALKREFKELEASMTPSQLEIEASNIDFNRRLKIRSLIREVMRAKEELSWINNPDLIELYNSINNHKELTTDDLAPLLYIKHKLQGVKLKEEIKHVVIDEAQDYSSIQFKVIKELTKCISMTVVGDANQRLIPLEGELPMLNLHNIAKDLDIEHFSLEKSYRSTKEIMEYANRFLKQSRIVPLVRSGSPVLEEKFKNEEELSSEVKSVLDKLANKGYESIAIVCKDLQQLESFGEKLKAVSYIKVLDKEDIIYTGGTVLIPSYFAKGLEFDVVIVIDSEKSSDTVSDSDDKIKYVMCTRALHELYNFVYKAEK